jgi:putative membrane protein
VTAPEEPPCSSPAEDRDVDPRFTWANERTFLAWNRTALALVAGGLAAAQLGDFASDATRLLVALPPIAFGAVLAVTSYRRWQANERALREDSPLPPPNVTALLAAGVAALAIVLAAVVIIDAALA